MKNNIDQQLRSNDCGISAVKTVCNILDVEISRDIIQENIALSANGASLNSMQKFFKNHGFETKYELLDVNTLNGNAPDIKKLLPCITPVKSRTGLHYLVIEDIKNDKFSILDPNEGATYKLTIQEFRKKAYFSSSMLEYLDVADILFVQIKEGLEEKGIELPNRPSYSELTDMANKLTYFSYIEHNFGFKDTESGTAFLKDLIFNQELSAIPEHFRSLEMKQERVKIKAPILLSIKKTERAKPATLEGEVNVYYKLYKSVKGIKDLWYIFIATTFIAAIISYVSVFINQILIDHVLPSYQFDVLVLFAIGVGIFTLFDLIFYVYKKYVSIHLGLTLDKYFLKIFDQKLNDFSIRYLQSFQKGDLTERLSDSMRLKAFFLSFFTGVFVKVIIAIFSISILVIISWQISIIVLAVLVLFTAMFFFFTPIIKNLERTRYTRKAAYFSKFLEKIDGIQVIKSMGLEAVSSKEIHSKIDDLIDIKKKAKYVGLLNTIMGSLVVSSASLAIIVLTSRQMILYGTVTLGMLITFLALSRKIFSAFGSLLDYNLDLQEHSVILNRFFDFSEKEREDLSELKGVEKIIDFEFKKLSIQNAFFAYTDENYVLKDLSLDIERGEKVWILGQNGTGKSTLCKILSLLYLPTSGDILINDIHGTMYSERALKKKILLVSAEDMIFNETLLYNITFGKKVDLEKLIEFAKVLNFYEFIDKQPEKLNYLIHENGRNLSTGQRKKVLMLRALMADVDLILLDEIFNGIDSVSKEKAELLIDLIEDKSFIIISHIPIEKIRFKKKYNLENGLLLEQTT